ncbi:DprA-like winged helix domain-containing protein [Mesobaculum littorinae]
MTRDGRGQVVPLKRRRRQDARPAADPAAPAHHDETAPDDAARSAGAGTRATSSRSGPSSTAGPRVSGPSSRGAGAGSGQSAPNSRNRDLHADILSHLGASPVLEDHLIRDIGLSAGRVLPEIVTLELQGRIERHPGGFLSRLPDR